MWSPHWALLVLPVLGALGCTVAFPYYDDNVVHAVLGSIPPVLSFVPLLIMNTEVSLTGVEPKQHILMSTAHSNLIRQDTRFPELFSRIIRTSISDFCCLVSAFTPQHYVACTVFKHAKGAGYSNDQVQPCLEHPRTRRSPSSCPRFGRFVEDPQQYRRQSCRP